MSKDIYPISELTLNYFLNDNGFSADKSQKGTSIVWRKGDVTINVPKKRELNETEVKEVLNAAGLVNEFATFMGGDATPSEDFERAIRFTVERKKK